MPSLKVYGYKFCIGSDDFAFPALGALFLNLVEMAVFWPLELSSMNNLFDVSFYLHGLSVSVAGLLFSMVLSAVMEILLFS